MPAITNSSSLISRSSAAAATLALALMLGACGGETAGSQPAAADQVKDLKVGATPTLSGLGLRVALSEGDFTASDLNVTAVANKSANDAVPQLLSGELQVAQMDTITFMQARSQGLPVRIIAVNGEQSTNGEDGEMSAAGVVAKADSPISSPADLVGKKVGVPAIKTQTWMNIRAFVDAAGGDSSKIEFVEVPSAQTIDLVMQGTVEASTPAEPLMSSSIAAGKVKLVHNTDAPGNQGVPSSVYVATEEFIAKNPDTVKDFADSVYAAAKKVNGNRELAAKVAQAELKYTPEQLNNAFYQTFGDSATTPAQLDKISDLAVKYGILTDKPKAEDLLADSK
ncbi:ABC transporter substrate-binding protein [Pseudarthrobacter oxydans]|uniref:ABC transporter substrate-binding protein n=1 Tax=Pseudarthrobacter oxydans TaxID=1671 RepID=UPI003D2D761F